MFPLNSNVPYINDNGKRDRLGNVIGSGGGGGGGSNIYHGETIPSESLGKEGDIYLYTPSNGVMVDFTLYVTKALRDNEEVSYSGAQEIQVFFTKDGVSRNIIEFPDFHCGGSGGITSAFDGDTDGSYWEQTRLPIMVTFGATIPSDWDVDKLVVWQRNSLSYHDVWKDFTLICNNTVIVSESGLTQSDWAGAGKGTEFNITNQPLMKSVGTVFYKINIDDVVQWIS